MTVRPGTDCNRSRLDVASKDFERQKQLFALMEPSH